MLPVQRSLWSRRVLSVPIRKWAWASELEACSGRALITFSFAHLPLHCLWSTPWGGGGHHDAADARDGTYINEWMDGWRRGEEEGVGWLGGGHLSSVACIEPD
ncbi:hypothetical protein B0I35DRAFT_429870 [Stachybotrys elegans]|uniref:Uncharacterized protein n=1 Tax=Stachybotrys elegans TaxID=80388 RepID=A0A8K0SN86_9HYPO|nr:hypothetical protein B0I35DRAFT_429870 [Stachybotrys elegans]